MKKSVSKGNKSKVKIIIALVTSVVAVSAIGIGLGVGLSGSDDGGSGGSKTQSQVISSIDDLKASLENLSKDPIVYDYAIETDLIWIDIDDDFFVNVIKKPIFKISSELEAQYQIRDAVNLDGDLTIDLRIRKRGNTEWINLNPYVVKVTGITFSGIERGLKTFRQKILERNSENGLLEIELGDLENIKDKYFNPLYAVYPVLVSSIKILSLESQPIKRDGKAIIKFEVTTIDDETFNVLLEFKVGQDTWNAIEMLENMNTDLIYKANGITSTNWKNLDDDFFSTIIEKEKPNLPDNTEVQYRIKDAISNNGNLEIGNLVVDFRYRRKDITNDLWTTIPSQYKLDIFLDKDLFDAQTALKNLSKDVISITMPIDEVTSWQKITDEVYSTILKVNPPSIPTNVEVEYKIPNAITEDGRLTVNLRYKKVGSSNWYSITHIVEAIGLNRLRAKTYIDNLQRKAKQYFFDNISQLKSTFTQGVSLTRENANLIFDFPEGEEYHAPVELLPIYLTIEELTESSDFIRLTFTFVYNGVSDDVIYDIYQ